MQIALFDRNSECSDYHVIKDNEVIGTYHKEADGCIGGALKPEYDTIDNHELVTGLIEESKL